MYSKDDSVTSVLAEVCVFNAVVSVNTNLSKITSSMGSFS